MPSNDTNYAYVRGEILPLENASLHISDLSIQRGFGVFDYFKVEADHPLFLNDYLARFRESARLMTMQLPHTDEQLREIIYELITRNNMPLSGMKMILTGGYSENSYDLAEPSLLIMQQPLAMPGPEMVSKGIKIITHEYIREIPRAKTINYTMGIRLIGEVKSKAASDVLYHLNGAVSEFPRCNLFVVRQDGTVRTPDTGILWGITRKNVLALAANKYPVQEGMVTLSELREAKEVFLTSTTKRILPIVQVDDTVIGEGVPGPVTQTLLQDLILLEEQDRKLQKQL